MDSLLIARKWLVPCRLQNTYRNANNKINNKLMKNLIFITLLFFFGVSCKKETSVVIQAQGYNTSEGTAYAGQEYAVSESWTPFFETGTYFAIIQTRDGIIHRKKIVIL
ncbi:hypothetical protein [Brumimicrobium aurantiacum]|uniref:Uncharacterized protein n=1 Tax=Brumimicrobium aurantiacum TaxID=1737063 RepID=A0A3E1F0S4_9FLAO|nr:hypothetical protein [Brumimicrobium aurantiacum]RFC55416.1 hypothetical protein DXU93_00335 [Brumimicrobium aurantiacum]